MPKFKHDCVQCHFLGEFRAFDLYFCRQTGIPTIIVRYGNDGPDYSSGLYEEIPLFLNDYDESKAHYVAMVRTIRAFAKGEIK